MSGKIHYLNAAPWLYGGSCSSSTIGSVRLTGHAPSTWRSNSPGCPTKIYLGGGRRGLCINSLPSKIFNLIQSEFLLVATFEEHIYVSSPLTVALSVLRVKHEQPLGLIAEADYISRHCSIPPLSPTWNKVPRMTYL